MADESYDYQGEFFSSLKQDISDIKSETTETKNEVKRINGRLTKVEQVTGVEESKNVGERVRELEQGGKRKKSDSSWHQNSNVTSVIKLALILLIVLAAGGFLIITGENILSGLLV